MRFTALEDSASVLSFVKPDFAKSEKPLVFFEISNA